MPHKTRFQYAALFGFAALICAAGAQAEQYAYPMESSGSPEQNYYPAPANNYVSSPATSTYQNPYVVPAATASSYKPISVPGSSQNDPTYPPINPAPTQASYQPVPAPQPAPQYQPAPDPQPTYAPVAQPAYAPAPQPTYAPVPQYQPASSGSGLEGLPSFSSEPDLDPKKNYSYQPRASSSGNSETPLEPIKYHPYMGLETRSGMDLGADFVFYTYHEPTLGVTETGEMAGFSARGTGTFGNHFFASGEVSYGFGQTDYKGSGTLDNTDLSNWEWRALFGRDFLLTQQYSVSPYIGLGYRTLWNDARGVTSTGAAGYRRYNQLDYLPIGISPRTHIDSNARLATNLEYDVVLHGLQKSYLSDANLGDPNMKNEQTTGSGFRGEIMYETRTWSLGPTFTYWNIAKSNKVSAIDHSAITCAGVGGPPCIITSQEPSNRTFEAGVQFRWHFF